MISRIAGMRPGSDAAGMSPVLSAHLVPILLVFLLAGTVKGVTGMGLPTVAMGLLSSWLAPVEAAALLALPSLLTNLQQAWGTHTGALLRRLWPMLAGIAAGTWAGAGLLTGQDPAPARLGLAALLMLYALLGLTRWQPSLSPRRELVLGPLAGAATGLLTGATGVFVLPSVPYLGALRLQRDALVQALGLCFGIATLALAAALAARGTLPLHSLPASLLALLPTAVGVALGTRLRRHLPPQAFRRVFFLALLALGLHLGWQAIG